MVEADLLEREEAKYRAVWEDPSYRVSSPGERYFAHALDWMQPAPGSSVTDWGCGTGRVGAQLFVRGHTVRLVDIAPNAYRGDLPFVEACLWDLPIDLGPTDYGFCADVMEHIPPEHVDAVLRGIAQRTRLSCYFQIALFDDIHFTSHGPLHLSVFPETWWMDKINAIFRRAEFKMVKRKHLLALASMA